MKLSCQEGLLPGASLEDKLTNLKRFGYEALEVWGAGLGDRVSELSAASKTTNVPVGSICAGFRGCPLDATKAERDLAWNDIKDILKAAGKLGSVGVIMVPVFGPPRLPDLSPLQDAVSLELELFVAQLKDAAPVAADAGTLILIEPLNRYETHLIKTLEDAVRVCERVDHPSVRIMADFFHMSIEEADIPAAIRKAGDWIAHVHLADSNRLLPGLGHTDFRSGFAALKDIGFDGFMALECGVPEPANDSLTKSAQYLKSCLPA
ncbi:MAG: sugar phosphate isomerase/epimerase [Armatimonadetes bacterium]|nr:sugar phosphate isomerase/epimerase [Armatimonadota bacterium]